LGLEPFERDEKLKRSRNRHKEIFLQKRSYSGPSIQKWTQKFTKENYLLTREKVLAGIAVARPKKAVKIIAVAIAAKATATIFLISKCLS